MTKNMFFFNPKKIINFLEEKKNNITINIKKKKLLGTENIIITFF